MDITIRDSGEKKFIAVNGEIDLFNVADFKKTLFQLTEGEFSSIIVDMKNVSYIDSSGIGVLVAGQKKMRAHSGQFALVNVGEDVHNILKLATLDKFFKIYMNESEIL